MSDAFTCSLESHEEDRSRLTVLGGHRVPSRPQGERGRAVTESCGRSPWEGLPGVRSLGSSSMGDRKALEATDGGQARCKSSCR